MIKKLTLQDNMRILCGKDYMLALRYVQTTINELVDAVNILQAQVAILQEYAHPTATTEQEKIAQGFKNLQDPYIEQQKWIGKLCRCWDSDINDDIWGILQDIKDNKTEKYYLYGIGYEHCEPVKPADDIIYKGDK